MGLEETSCKSQKDIDIGKRTRKKLSETENEAMDQVHREKAVMEKEEPSIKRKKLTENEAISAESTTMDIVDFFPEKIYKKIFSRLNVRDLCAAILTSAKWNRAIGQSSACMKKVWLNPSRPSTDILRETQSNAYSLGQKYDIIKNSTRKYQKVFLSDVNFDESWMDFFTRNDWKAVEMFQCTISSYVIWTRILRALAPSLTHLAYVGDWDLFDGRLSDITFSLRKLKMLCAGKGSVQTQLQSNILNSFLASQSRTLKLLLIPSGLSRTCIEVIYSLEVLEKLCFEDSTSINWTLGIEPLPLNFSITTLILDYSDPPPFNENCLQILAQSLPNLTTLSFTKFTDNVFDFLKINNAKLESIECVDFLVHSSRIMTDNPFPNLTSLRIISELTMYDFNIVRQQPPVNNLHRVLQELLAAYDASEINARDEWFSIIMEMN